MNILIIGSGGREHALALSIKKIKLFKELYILPGNAGTGETGKNTDISDSDFESIKAFVLKQDIEMIVCGPEVPLSQGLADFFSEDEKTKRITFIGPKKKGAQLESSKEFAKEFMLRHNIPTARYKSFRKEQEHEAIEFLNSIKPPYVLKADGLAAGKGVIITESHIEAKKELRAMFDGKFGASGKTVVIEEFLRGIELSVFALTDGKDYVLLPEAKDYKRIGENDTGPNTGGMGAVSPVPFADKEFMQKIEQRIIKPTIEGLQKDEIPYIGFLFFGLMNVGGEPYVIEYNVRLGDPESEAVLLRIESDFLQLLKATGEGKLKTQTIDICEKSVASVILVSGGYPGKYEKGMEIRGVDKITDSIFLHMGTLIKQGKLLTNGGRVLAVSSFGSSIKEALKTSYKNAESIDFKNKYYRKDIGFDL